MDGTEFILPCDFLIRATGQVKQTDIFDLAGIDYDSRGNIVVNEESFQCSKSNYFAAGDAVNGGAEVVNACAEGKKAAKGIHKYLNPI